MTPFYNHSKSGTHSTISFEAIFNSKCNFTEKDIKIDWDESFPAQKFPQVSSLPQLGYWLEYFDMISWYCTLKTLWYPFQSLIRAAWSIFYKIKNQIIKENHQWIKAFQELWQTNRLWAWALLIKVNEISFLILVSCQRSFKPSRSPKHPRSMSAHLDAE